MSYLTKHPIHIRASNEMIVSRMVSSFGFAIASAVTSIYLSGIGLSDSTIGIVSGLASLSAVIFSFFVPVILEKINEMLVYVSTTILLGFLYFVLGFLDVIPIVVLIFIITRLMIMIGGNAVGIIFKDVSKNKEDFTRAQGLYGSLGNFSWFTGPMIGGLMVDRYGIASAFGLAAVFLIIGSLLVVLMPIKLQAKKREKLDGNTLENIKFFLSRPNLIIAYIQAYGVQMWWGFLWSFLPLFMIHEGYSYSTIGFVLAATQLPLFLLEYTTVKTLRYLTPKKIFFWSFLVVALSSLAMYGFNDILVIITLTIFCSVPMAFLEPLRDIFFFSQVTKLEEEKTYPTYYTSFFTGAMTGKLGVGVVIGLFGGRASFLFLGLLFIAISLSSLKIKQSSR